MLTCSRKSSYYYSRSGHRMAGGNGTTVSGAATEMYLAAEGAAGGLRANRSGAAGVGAALRAQGGAQLHYSSVSNLATSGVGRGGGGGGGGGGGLLTTTALHSARRESDFLSPSHALVGYESGRLGGIVGAPKVSPKNGSFMKTSASIGSKLATANVTGQTEVVTGNCTRSSSKSESLGGGGGGGKGEGDADGKGKLEREGKSGR